MIQVNGKNGIYAKVLKDSISPQGVRMMSFEVSYPRLILAELNTHCMVCKASASSRAIPFNKMKETLTGAPVRFGQANPGMQDKGEDYTQPVAIRDGAQLDVVFPVDAWDFGRQQALELSESFYKAGYHKQVYNRLTEPFQMMKTVLTATEWANFWWLRNHEAADPTLAELARCMFEAAKASTPQELQPGEWHLPYVETVRRHDGEFWYYIDVTKQLDDGTVYDDVDILTLEDAKQVSAARCAAVSFRNVDYDVEKSKSVYERLLGADRKHASAFQHQGTPMKSPEDVMHPEDGWLGTSNNASDSDFWEEGISHADRQGQLWSAQLRGWVMLRKLIEGENVPGFFPPEENIDG